ncbi:ribonuclease P/MRP protein subunit POP7 PWA37_000028 [Arxiozyma heterogenica]|uniref:Uncharacterized protein n=1 Tax=Arxiozyma heterogenica TaxID=278026 RepID=A0AAN7ZXC2_9SACH|nr:hypothetical protein RI543_004367 [Kazachstania heterogenica]
MSKKYLMDTKLIRKRPTLKTLSHKKIKTTIYIKSTTPYISALKRIKKFLSELQKHGAKYVTLLGMGKAVEKTLALGSYFSQEKGQKVQVMTRTIKVIDELKDISETQESVNEEEETDENDEETFLKRRTLSGVEVRIFPL